MKATQVLKTFPVLAFLLFLYFPTFRWLIGSWLGSPYYSHGFLVPLISALIAWKKRGELRGQSSPLFLPLLALGLGIYLLGFLLHFQFICALSLLVVLCGLVLFLRGREGLKSLGFPLSFLLFAIPFPYLDELGYFLQSFSAASSASILSLLGIPVVQTGAEIHLKQASFYIGLPCSGINGLISLLALAALLGYLLKASLFRRVIFFFLAFPIALLANLARILSLLLIGHLWGAEAALRFFHFSFDLLFFMVALACLFTLARLLRFCSPERSHG